MHDGTLNNLQLRKLLDTIYDGHNETFFYIMQIQAFYVKKKSKRREQQVYLWCVRNKIVGENFVNFFKANGFLDGMNYIVNKLNGNKNFMNNIKIDECY